MEEQTLEHNVVPFEHQIAGHGALLKLENNRVAKPLIDRELWFYRTLENNICLLPFTAPFHGTIDVKFTKDKVQQWIKEVQDAEVRGKGQNTMIEFEGNQVSINPWSLKVTNDNLGSMLKKGVLVKKYLVLDDLTKKYKEPCICDLKIGTRQHGDDAAPDKKYRHTAKCENTTSKTLGMRLCGQMVFQPSTKQYKHFNKYEGRQVTLDSMKITMAQFFDNGTTFRLDILHKYIHILKKLLEVVQSDAMTCKYRFYSSSLLLLYEGDISSHSEGLCDLKMIDFAHTFPFEKGDPEDDGYIFGLKSFLNILEQIATLHSA